VPLWSVNDSVPHSGLTQAEAGAPGEFIAPDSLAEVRDRAAEVRDRAAEVRDGEAQGREDENSEHDRLAARTIPTRHPYRAGAASDRSAAAVDRQMASKDRDAAAADRDAATSEIARLIRDELTGVYRRSEGRKELGREILKARRTGEPFTLAFIDVDHLKATNDELGHEAGDRLLARVAASIQSVVREYDVVVRYGGDEFLCGALGLTLADAHSRFEQLNSVMAARGRRDSVGRHRPTRPRREPRPTHRTRRRRNVPEKETEHAVITPARAFRVGPWLTLATGVGSLRRASWRLGNPHLQGSPVPARHGSQNAPGQRPSPPG
jgi:diguanylate cyclase (GGDEF)-like protein